MEWRFFSSCPGVLFYSEATDSDTRRVEETRVARQPRSDHEDHSVDLEGHPLEIVDPGEDRASERTSLTTRRPAKPRHEAFVVTSLADAAR